MKKRARSKRWFRVKRVVRKVHKTKADELKFARHLNINFLDNHGLEGIKQRRVMMATDLRYTNI